MYYMCTLCWDNLGTDNAQTAFSFTQCNLKEKKRSGLPARLAKVFKHVGLDLN